VLRVRTCLPVIRGTQKNAVPMVASRTIARGGSTVKLLTGKAGVT